jgi:broad specificity phosphatase PhoE
LAAPLAQYLPSIIYSSKEPKAIETADILSGVLELPRAAKDGLHEHSRNNVEWTSTDSFRAKIQDLFRRQDEIIFGEESASETVTRFSDCVNDILQNHPNQSVAIVSHGTAITLFVSSQNEIEPYSFWRSLEMPSMVILSRPELRLESVILLPGESGAG